MKCTASIGEGKSWIKYEDGTLPDEIGLYRDAMDEQGNLLYCDGESCDILEETETHVTLYNDNNPVGHEKFTICKHQFDEDFILE